MPGNILLIGNSGTGKTTIMNNIQRMYHEVEEYRPFRAMTIINANLLVDAERLEFQPARLLTAVEQRARALVGEKPTAEDLIATMERATVCIDEIDKMSSIVAGKPNAIGVVLQQGLLTLMEGEVVAHRAHVWEDGEEREVVLSIDTRHMMFICGGAFEGLYDQVYLRVIKPGSGEKLKSQAIQTADGQVRIESRFALSDFLKPEDLFEYGMVPQFMARFDDVVLLRDLDTPVLKEILLQVRRFALPPLQAVLRCARDQPRDRRRRRRDDRRRSGEEHPNGRSRAAQRLRADRQPARVRPVDFRGAGRCLATGGHRLVISVDMVSAMPGATGSRQPAGTGPHPETSRPSGHRLL